VAEGFSSNPYSWEEETGPDEVLGDRKRYDDLVNKYLKEMETETGEIEGSEEGKSVSST